MVRPVDNVGAARDHQHTVVVGHHAKGGRHSHAHEKGGDRSRLLGSDHVLVGVGLVPVGHQSPPRGGPLGHHGGHYCHGLDHAVGQASPVSLGRGWEHGDDDDVCRRWDVQLGSVVFHTGK